MTSNEDNTHICPHPVVCGKHKTVAVNCPNCVAESVAGELKNKYYSKLFNECKLGWGKEYKDFCKIVDEVCK